MGFYCKRFHSPKIYDIKFVIFVKVRQVMSPLKLGSCVRSVKC